MDPTFTLFKVEDINAIIKLFAYNIQDRIEEINCPPNSHDSSQLKKNDDCQYYIRKYKGYLTNDPEQIKYVQKMGSRIVQILKFFKERSKNQSMLEVVINKIQQRLIKMLNPVQTDVGKVIALILNISEYGFNISKPFIQQKKFQPHKTSKRMPIENQESTVVEEQLLRKRKTIGFYSLKRQKSKTEPKIIQPTKEQNERFLNSLYSILELDMGILLRNIENKQKMEKDCLRWNTSITNTVKNYEKEFSKRKKQKQENPLKEVKNKQVSLVNNWVSRKRKMLSQRKKRDSENIHLII